MISFFTRKFYFGLQEGIATILVRSLVCHMPAFDHFQDCTGHTYLCAQLQASRHCSEVFSISQTEIVDEKSFESCHFLFWISSFPVGIGLRGPCWPSLTSAGIGQVVHFVVSIGGLSICCSSEGVTVLSAAPLHLDTWHHARGWDWPLPSQRCLLGCLTFLVGIV